MISTRLLRVVAAVVCQLLAVSLFAQIQYTFTTLDCPLAQHGTASLTGIEGTTIVGSYSDTNSYVFHGFVYEGGIWRTLDYPNAVSTFLNGISGTNIVGRYDGVSSSGAFLYNGSSFITLDDPLGTGPDATYANAVCGSKVVGHYYNTNSVDGFLYEAGTYTTLVYPGNPYHTVPYGISGNVVVGEYIDAGATFRGFLYDGSTWATLNPSEAWVTSATAVSGDVVVGTYRKSDDQYHGFIYRRGIYTTVDAPMAGRGKFVGTLITGISAEVLVGTYIDSNHIYHPFIASPAPGPELKISFSGGVVRVSWPYSSVGWELQQTSDLDSASWTASSGVSNDGTNSFLMITPPTEKLFFRLSQ